MTYALLRAVRGGDQIPVHGGLCGALPRYRRRSLQPLFAAPSSRLPVHPESSAVLELDLRSGKGTKI